MKKQFEEVVCEVIMFENEDVITGSGIQPDTDFDIDGGDGDGGFEDGFDD